MEHFNQKQLNEKLRVDCKNCSLGGICIPRGLDAGEIEQVNQIIHRKRTLHKGDFLFRAGDQFRNLSSLKSGTIKITSTDHRGNEHIIGVLLPGEMLGFDGLANGQHEYDAVVLETASVCEIPANRLESLCREVPNLQHQLFQHIGCKLNEERCKMLLNKRPAEERLAAFLMDLSDRYNKRGFSATEFNLSLTRQEIGNHLGLALETVSRLLSAFQMNGLIEVKRKQIRILEMEKLRAIYKGDNNFEDKKTA